MPAADSAERLTWRVDTLESKADDCRGRVATLEKDSIESKTLLREVMADILELKGTLNKLVWAIVGLALTIAASTIAAATGAILP